MFEGVVCFFPALFCDCFLYYHITQNARVRNVLDIFFLPSAGYDWKLMKAFSC